MKLCCAFTKESLSPGADLTLPPHQAWEQVTPTFAQRGTTALHRPRTLRPAQQEPSTTAQDSWLRLNVRTVCLATTATCLAWPILQDSARLGTTARPVPTRPTRPAQPPPVGRVRLGLSVWWGQASLIYVQQGPTVL